MSWKKLFLALVAAAGLPVLAGCEGLPGNEAYENCCPPAESCYGTYRNDYGGLLNAPCRGPWGYGPGHCGLVGFTKQMGAESCALVHVLFSDRWYGGYPYSSCGPWVGRYEGCCGCGGMADPCACCNGTPSGQPPAQQ